jgi:glycosyltransferase involved in cell wall biosynthesis
VNVSIIIPAYNASTTLEEALDSVVAQTVPDWEAIIVNDGSTDATAKIAGSFAAKNGRIHVINRTNGGESAARNTGIVNASHDWLVFLDADDWIAPTYIERLSAVLEADSSLDAVHCGWARIASDGTQVIEDYRPPAGNLFPVLARRAAFAVHACMVRKALVDAVGRFDTTLKTCPDWDLWQRVARAGAKFGSVPETLAYYRMTAKSASLDADQLFRDGLRVLRTGHGPDPRVPNPVPEFAEGLSDSTVESQQYYLLCWNAGLLLGTRRDARRLLKIVGDDVYPRLNSNAIAQCIFDSATLPSRKSGEGWEELWPRIGNMVERFLVALEARSQTPNLAEEALLELKKRALKNSLTWRPVIEQVERAVADSKASVEAHLEASRSDIAGAKEEIAKLAAENHRLKSEAGEMREAIATLAGKEAELAAAFDMARSRSGALEREKESSTVCLEESRQYAETLRKSSAELSAALDHARSQLRISEGEKASVEAHLEASRSDIAGAQKEIAKLAAELGAALDQARSRCEALEHEKESAAVCLDESRQYAETLRKSSAELAAEIHLLASEAGEMREGIATHAAREAELAAALDHARSQVRISEGEKASLEAHLQASRSDFAGAGMEIAKLTAELAAAGQRNEAGVREKTALNARLGDSIRHANQREQQNAELIRELEDAATRIRGLEKRGDFMASELTELSHEATRLEKEKTHLAAELPKWQRSCAERAQVIEEIQQDAWVRFGRKLRIVRPREIPPATHEMSPLPEGGNETVSGAGEATEPNWDLRVGEGNEAHVIYPRHDHEMVCIGISRVNTKETWDIQLNRPGIPVESGKRYAVTFRARAGRPRTIAVGFAKAYDPWSSLGFYREFRLEPEWQTFQEEFTALEDDDNTRIHFDLGGKNVGVDLTTVKVNGVENRDSQSVAPAENTVAQGQIA